MVINDKILHFVVSFAVVLVLFFSSSYLYGVFNVRKRLIFAGVVTFLMGLIKELGDGWLWEWPWCPCSADLNDLFADVIGIAVAIIGVINVGFITAVLTPTPRQLAAEDNEIV